MIDLYIDIKVYFDRKLPMHLLYIAEIIFEQKIGSLVLQNEHVIETYSIHVVKVLFFTIVQHFATVMPNANHVLHMGKVKHNVKPYMLHG